MSLPCGQNEERTSLRGVVEPFDTLHGSENKRYSRTVLSLQSDAQAVLASPRAASSCPPPCRRSTSTTRSPSCPTPAPTPTPHHTLVNDALTRRGEVTTVEEWHTPSTPDSGGRVLGDCTVFDPVRGCSWPPTRRTSCPSTDTSGSFVVLTPESFREPSKPSVPPGKTGPDPFRACFGSCFSCPERRYSVGHS